jgi:hypothetical protein
VKTHIKIGTFPLLIIKIYTSMKLKGAVIMIGSLLWEDETNCIKSEKDLAKERKIWRDTKLLMGEKVQIELPIRYGRVSSSRYCTYTMAFSNSVSEKGKAYCVPYKDEIDISNDNFNQLYCQALELAQVEGISKDGANNLFKNWGAVALKFNPRFEREQSGEAKKMADFWQRFFVKLPHDLYRIDNTEEHSITKDGILNFDIGEMTDIAYVLATPVSPNVKVYPSGEDVARTMMNSREQYFTYFKENYKNNIRTKDDEEILNCLPEKIRRELEQ